MKVNRKVLKAIGRYVPGDIMELEPQDAAAFDLMQITRPLDAEDHAVVATRAMDAEDGAAVQHEPIRSKRNYRRRDMRAAE